MDDHTMVLILECPISSVGFLDAFAIRVIGAGESGGPCGTIFLIVDVIEIARGVVHHVAGSVVRISALQLVVRGIGHAQVFRRAFGHTLAQQVPPGIVVVAVAPVLGMTVEKSLGAVGSGVLRRGQPVQRIVSKRLIAALVAIVGDAPDVSVVAAAQVEVVVKIQHIAPAIHAVGRNCASVAGSHAAGLEPIVVNMNERISDPAKAVALTADATLLALPKNVVTSFLGKRFTMHYFIVNDLIWKEDFRRIAIRMVDADLNSITLAIRIRQIHSHIENDCDRLALVRVCHFSK
jgi:hypothetical protein